MKCYEDSRPGRAELSHCFNTIIFYARHPHRCWIALERVPAGSVAVRGTQRFERAKA